MCLHNVPLPLTKQEPSGLDRENGAVHEREYSSLSFALCWWAAAQCQHTVYSLLLLTEAGVTFSLSLRPSFIIWKCKEAIWKFL